MKRIILEVSLKPFRSLSDQGIRVVCREILRQWQPLIHGAENLSFLLWTGDGSEILDYQGHKETEIEWAKWIGIANEPWKEDQKNLHTWRWPYCENPPRLTYERLEFIVRTLKFEAQRTTGKPVTVGSTFDPGPEFSESSFKYKRHPEISRGNIMGHSQWVHCAAILKGDTTYYAGFHEGIPEGTTLGTFIGRQSQYFLRDLHFDYLWLSNGFGYSLDSWNVTGEVFDGKKFNLDQVNIVRESILGFWKDFRKECPHFPIETRGSNLSTGMDLSSDASPLRDIYRGNFKMTAPPNSPWAAMTGDYGLELVGWLSHIAELPEGGEIPFRYYIHDPWWLNSPWIDRYGREPHDIYLPLSVARIGKEGEITPPTSVALLTIDNSYGQMPEEVATEITPHLRQAFKDFPDEPGLLTWIYPFDEYHDWASHTPGRINEAFFGDWFMRSAINQGFPLNTVVSSANFLKSKQRNPKLYDQTILVAPAPDAKSKIAQAMIQHIQKGGQILLYGPLDHADPEILQLLNLRLGTSISGELQIRHSLTPDELLSGKFPTKMNFQEVVSGGGINVLPPTISSQDGEVFVEVESKDERRAFAVMKKFATGGKLGWVRGAFCEEVSTEKMLPQKEDPDEWFSAERLMRWVLEKFGYSIRFTKSSLNVSDPLILAARKHNAWFFSGYTVSTNTHLTWKFPLGTPVPTGCDLTIENNIGKMNLPRTWHRECRIFIEQLESGEISCRERYSGEIGIHRRLFLSGLKNATIHFLRDTQFPESLVRFQKDDAYLGEGTLVSTIENRPNIFTAIGVTGSLLISW